MLLHIQHIGAKDRKRFYHVQTPRGLSGILALSGRDRLVTLDLAGTHYSREYPCPYPIEGIPRIRDLEGGYQVVQTFLATWEHATEEQRDALTEYTKPIAWFRSSHKTGYKPKRTKTRLRLTEDQPVHVPAKRAWDAGVWYKVMAAELRAALKGTTAAENIRIGHITVRRSVLYGLVNTKSALTADPILEIQPEWEALHIRSADHKARVTLKHGAGDKHKGYYGFTRRIQFVAA